MSDDNVATVVIVVCGLAGIWAGIMKFHGLSSFFGLYIIAVTIERPLVAIFNWLEKYKEQTP